MTSPNGGPVRENMPPVPAALLVWAVLIATSALALVVIA